MAHWKQWLVAGCLALATLPAAAQMKKSELVVDGSDWMSATQVERRAFLIGAANLIIAEQAYAKNKNTSPAPVSAEITKAVATLKLGDIEALITRWYEANPSRMATPVMGVVWRTIVRGQK